ncbi:hypothetical protein D8U09_11380 [Salmonella enterica]|nr:hypothetical protein [Salmonella enterica]EAN1726713.1 hypothetical protein [Salmonella enterica]EAP2706476.1 hypothetical protein [Salmonella enterica]EAQ9103868.1 hypothetical protein [Salmonella enterica]EAR1152780.1 hypothetical protein [Salmonella enterica]
MILTRLLYILCVCRKDRTDFWLIPLASGMKCFGFLIMSGEFQPFNLTGKEGIGDYGDSAG